jgi:hypothetical protein
MCVYRVSGGSNSDSSELYGEVVRNTTRNRTIGPLGCNCNEHITPWTDPILLGFSKTGSGTRLSEGTDMTKAVKIIDRVAGTQFAQANSRKA